MNRKNLSMAVLLLCLIISFSLTASTVSAQDMQSDRSSIRVLLVLGNDKEFGGSENFSYVRGLLNASNPELGLNLNLTVKSSLASESDLKGFDLLIACIPSAASIPNATIFGSFAENGNSLFLLSDYNGSGMTNSSGISNEILNESNINGVSFNSDAISITNATTDWQMKVYNNNSFAVKVNSSDFLPNTSTRSVFSGVSSVVTLSCSLNITSPEELSSVATGSAPSDSGSRDWLLLTDSGVERSVLCGSASMFNNTYLAVASNQILFKQLVLWLVERFQIPAPNVFPYLVLASCGLSILGIAVYLVSKRTKASV
jgi:hypothetical protein